MFGLGVTEILVVMVIALIFLGPKKLPGLAKGLGKGMKSFQDALRGIETEINNVQEESKPLPSTPDADSVANAETGAAVAAAAIVVDNSDLDESNYNNDHAEHEKDDQNYDDEDQKKHS